MLDLMRLAQGRWSAAGLAVCSLCADLVDVRPIRALQRTFVQSRVQCLPGVRPATPLNVPGKYYFAEGVFVWGDEKHEM